MHRRKSRCESIPSFQPFEFDAMHPADQFHPHLPIIEIGMQRPDSGHGGVADVIAEFESDAGLVLQGQGCQRLEVNRHRFRRSVGGKQVWDVLSHTPQLYPENPLDSTQNENDQSTFLVFFFGVLRFRPGFDRSNFHHPGIQLLI
jgi:hypothetical protein